MRTGTQQLNLAALRSLAAAIGGVSPEQQIQERGEDRAGTAGPDLPPEAPDGRGGRIGNSPDLCF